MRSRLILPIALLIALLAVPAGASAKSRYLVGMGDQNPQMFSDPNFTSLKLKRVRVIVPWDWRDPSSDPAAINAYMAAAAAGGKDVMVAFSALRGCYNDGRYSRSSFCKAPSQKRYRASIKAFRAAYPQVKTFQPWNELNNKSQPTYKSPKLAARYYKTLKKLCKGCTVVAADLLDTSNAFKYVKRFMKHTKKQKPRLWGLHNYGDVNRFRKGRRSYTARFLRTVPGKVWLTETGGLVTFLPKFRTSTRRANKAVKFMFKLADTYSRKRKGSRSVISRLYPYTFYGYVETTDNRVTPRFDAGLVGPLVFNPGYSSLSAESGKVRAPYKTFKRLVKRRSK